VAVRTAREKSAGLAARATTHIPGGVNSNVRLAAPRVFFERGDGAWLWDIDGNDYVDYLLGQGPAFLGHAHERVNASVAAAVGRGMVFGAQQPLEVEVAERFCRLLGWPEMIRLGLTGTESVQAALRIARAHTGRRRFVRFEGHYHGWLDNVLISTVDDRTTVASEGQLASHLDDAETLPWNDLELLQALLAQRGDEFAAVIMEPIMVNAGSIVPRPGYLEGVRQLCNEHGIVLIFDEVITGFRVALGGASGLYGVTPDLATYGKALAGGWPVSALAGRGDLMERIGDGRVNHSGTFNASTMSLAAVSATLDVLTEDSPYARVADHGERLMNGLTELGRQHGVPFRTQGVPMAFHASFGPPEPVFDYRGVSGLDLAGYADFARALAAYGVWVAGRGVWYVSAAHGERELEVTLERVDAALRARS
jgi:glutamate-1-semialdehyde 2,1-aminomutase